MRLRSLDSSPVHCTPAGNAIARLRWATRIELPQVSADGNTVVCFDRTTATVHAPEKPDASITHAARINHAVLGADGVLVSGSDDGEIWITPPTGAPWSLVGHTSGIAGLVRVAGGGLLSFDFDGELRQWDLAPHVRVPAVQGRFPPTSEITPTGAIVYTDDHDVRAILPDGKLASLHAAGDSDPLPFITHVARDAGVVLYVLDRLDHSPITTYAWWPGTGAKVEVKGDLLPSGWVLVQALSSDRYATRQGGHTVVDDLHTGATIWKLPDSAVDAAVAFDAELRVALLAETGGVRVLTPTSDRQVTLPFTPDRFAIAARGTRAIVGDLSALWDCDLVAATCQAIAMESSLLGQLAATPDGARFAIAGGTKLVIYDPASHAIRTIARRRGLAQLAISDDGAFVAGSERIENTFAYPVFVSDVATGEERRLPADSKFDQVVALVGSSVSVILPAANPLMVFDSPDTLPRDRTLPDAIRTLTNAVIVNGVVSAPP